MKTEWIILADFAEVLNGKLYLMGGAWDNLTVNSLPAPLNFAIVTSFLVPWNETNQRNDVAIEFLDEDGNMLAIVNAQLEVGRPPGSTPGQTQRVMLAVNLSHKFEKLGTFVVKAKIEHQETTDITFRVLPSQQLMTQQLMGRQGTAPSI